MVLALTGYNSAINFMAREMAVLWEMKNTFCEYSFGNCHSKHLSSPLNTDRVDRIPSGEGLGKRKKTKMSRPFGLMM